jgi:signal transduction histidine kinase
MPVVHHQLAGGRDSSSRSDAPEATTFDPSVIERRIKAEQLRLLFSSPTPMIGAFITGAMMAAVLWCSIDHLMVILWATCSLCWTTSRIVLWLRFRRGEKADVDVLRLARPIILGVAISGVLWGVAGLAFYGPAEPEIRAIVLFLLACMVTGGAVTYAAYLPAHDVFVVACTVPIAIAALTRGTALDAAMGSAIVLYNALVLFGARAGNRSIANTIRMQIEKAGLVDALRAAKEKAEEANRIKSEFLANMSHELRTPLNAIIGFSDMISGQVLGPDAWPRYIDYSKHINASGLHLLQVINDILDLSKQAAGRFELDERPVDLTRVVHDSVAFIEPQANRRQIAIVVELPAHLPAFLADELRIRQALLNLLSNAVKFSHPASVVTVAIERASDGDLVIEVIDQGIGIKEADIPIVLEPFRQISGLLARSHDGTGLGLPLAKMLVEKHDGVLGIVSRLGQGTTVRLVFPAWRLGTGAEIEVAAAQ